LYHEQLTRPHHGRGEWPTIDDGRAIVGLVKKAGRVASMICRTLRFATFLAPGLLPVYRFITRFVGDRLGVLTELVVGDSYDRLAEADVSFVCGLAYIELAGPGGLDLEPLAAPVLRGARYGGRPVYFSDVVVRRDSPFRSFADLRGRSWCYNEPRSQSGYGITRYHLTCLGEVAGFFGRVIEAGWHGRSLQLVHAGAVDGSAIDSQVLALALRDRPEWAEGLRVLDSLGPSTIQPVVAAGWLPAECKAGIRAALLAVGDDPAGRALLARGLVERFVPVDDTSYDDLRRMRAACAAAGFLELR
jgi:phosphonate transport system substrate-binding protein